MPKMLADEGAEYDDGTVATESQQAKVSGSYVTASGVYMCSTFIYAVSYALAFQIPEIETKYPALQRHCNCYKHNTLHVSPQLVTQDVTQFLSWAAEPEHDDRKLMGVKWIFVLSLVFLTAAYYKRWKWAPIKSRRVVVDALN